MKFPILIIIVSFLVLSCSFFEDTSLTKEESPVVQVYDRYLYPSDLSEVAGKNTSAKDSAVKVSNFIDAWVRDQLILKRAELNLTESEKNVKWELEDYRAKLLIYKYEQKYIEQKLDTTITNEQINEYYAKHSHNFKLKEPVVKAVYLKLPKTAPQIYRVKWWFRSKRQQDSLTLNDYISKHATKYDTFAGRWLFFKDLLKESPIETENSEEFLKKNEYYETEDSLFNYYLRIKAYRLKNDVTPLIFVRNNVRTILLNDKKRNLIKKLEKNIYQDGFDKGFVKINETANSSDDFDN